MKILFLIRSLQNGGTERQLWNLTRGLQQRGHEQVVVVFYPTGMYHKKLLEDGIRVVSLGKQGICDIMGVGLRLWAFVRDYQPDLVYSFLPDANVFSGLYKRIFPAQKVVWGIRASYVQFRFYGLPARMNFLICKRLSGLVDGILVNSYAGRDFHIQNGFRASGMKVIPNGIDTDTFSPDLADRQRFRAQLGMAPEITYVGNVGRLDPMKDHRSFFRAVKKVGKKYPRVRFVCVGRGNPVYENELKQYAEELEISSKLRFFSCENEMPSVYRALDYFVSTSIGEGFANVVGEAMASGIHGLVTDVGDSARIIGKTGVVVPPGDSSRVADGLMQLMEKRSLESPRERILSHYSLSRFWNSTEQFLQEVLSSRGR